MRDTKLILETGRLQLREFLLEDVDALGEILGDAETMRFYPAPLDRNGVADWIERNRRRYENGGVGLWAMTWKSSGELIGDCGLIRQTIDNAAEVEIGYHVRRDHWRKGLATEAARACRDYGFAKLEVGSLVSMIRPENFPSRGVAEKNGMMVEKEVEWRGYQHLVYRIERKALG